MTGARKPTMIPVTMADTRVSFTLRKMKPATRPIAIFTSINGISPMEPDGCQKVRKRSDNSAIPRTKEDGGKKCSDSIQIDRKLDGSHDDSQDDIDRNAKRTKH